MLILETDHFELCVNISFVVLLIFYSYVVECRDVVNGCVLCDIILEIIIFKFHVEMFAFLKLH